MQQSRPGNSSKKTHIKPSQLVLQRPSLGRGRSWGRARLSELDEKSERCCTNLFGAFCRCDLHLLPDLLPCIYVCTPVLHSYYMHIFARYISSFNNICVVLPLWVSRTVTTGAPAVLPVCSPFFCEFRNIRPTARCSRSTGRESSWGFRGCGSLLARQAYAITSARVAAESSERCRYR